MFMLPGKSIMHDPFAMRPFFGYNFGHYLSHWLSMQNDSTRQLPKIFHVNWFRTDADDKFMWPGFGENARVLDWVLRRVDGDNSAVKTPIGYVPTPGAIDTSGLGSIDMDELMSIPRDFWLDETEQIDRYFREQINEDLPSEIGLELQQLRERLLESK